MNKEPLTILLVEDDADHAGFIINTLNTKRRKQLGFPKNEVIHASSLKEAEELLFHHKKSKRIAPHLVILDLMLKKDDGIELLRKIRKSDSIANLPVVILTTSASTDEIQRAYRHHANSYLLKPTDGTKGFEELGRDLEVYWRGWNKFPS